MAFDKKYGSVDIDGIPDDEPIFIIRAQDKSAPQVVTQYADTAIVNGSPSEHAAAARQVAEEMRDWQRDNESKVKAGD